MKNFASRLLLAFFLLVPVATFAQSTGTVVADCTTGVGLGYTPGSTRPMTLLPTGQACITGTISASLSGFTAASTGTPISVTTGGVTGNLPAGTVVVATNVGSTNGAYCALGASATTASQYIAPNGGWFAFTVGASTQLTCITASSTTTVNMTGGAGLPTGTGGGGGGSGGAVTVADGADVTQGAIADTAATAGSTGTLSAKLRYITTQLDNINTNVQAAVPAGTNRIGYTTNDPCTNKVKLNKPFTTNGTSSVELVAVSGSTTVYVCSLSFIAAGATTVAFTTGTGTACATNNAAVIGSTTANITNSMSFAANGGMTLGGGHGTVALGAASSAFCMVNGTNVYVSGNLTYVQE